MTPSVPVVAAALSVLAGLPVLAGAFPERAAAQEPAQGPRCIKCKNAGRLPCPEHKTRDCDLEHNVLYCSFMASCETCGGVGWTDCPRCESEAVEAALEKKRAAVPDHEAKLAKLDEEMGRRLRKAESDHFVLVWEIDELKVGRNRLDDHQLLHLYVDRLEELFADYTDVLGVEEQEFEEKPRVMVWYFEEDQREASLRFCEMQGIRGVKLLGSHPHYTLLGTKRFFKSDEDLHRNIIHNVAHLLMSHQRPSQWIGHIKGGWADAGVAHWFEDRFFGLCDNYCYQEVNTNQDFKRGKWRPAVRKMVAMDDAPPVAEVFRQNTTTLTLPHHAVSFSYVDFLIRKDAAKTNLLLQRLRSKVPTRDALQELFGLKPLEFEAEWKAWVLETYPAR